MSDTTPRPRRIITGLDADGKSSVIIDGPVFDHGSPAKLIWRTDAVPADNSGNDDTAAMPYKMAMLHDGGATFMITEMPVGLSRFMHITDTVDFMYIMSGRGVLELETGDVEVGPGDCVVDRGVMHSWRIDGPEPLKMISVMIPAKPLGQGRTI